MSNVHCTLNMTSRPTTAFLKTTLTHSQTIALLTPLLLQGSNHLLSLIYVSTNIFEIDVSFIKTLYPIFSLLVLEDFLWYSWTLSPFSFLTSFARLFFPLLLFFISFLPFLLFFSFQQLIWTECIRHHAYLSYREWRPFLVYFYL